MLSILDLYIFISVPSLIFSHRSRMLQPAPDTSVVCSLETNTLSTDERTKMIHRMWKLGHFIRAFAQMTISHEHLPKWQFCTDIFPNDNIPNTYYHLTISYRHFPKWQFPTDIFLTDNFPRTFLHMPFPGRSKFWDPTCCFNTKQNCKCNYITKSSFINVLSLLHKEQKYNTVHI